MTEKFSPSPSQNQKTQDSSSLAFAVALANALNEPPKAEKSAVHVKTKLFPANFLNFQAFSQTFPEALQ